MTPAESTVQKAWHEAMAALYRPESSSSTDQVLARVLQHYREPHRHWHTASHIAAMIDQLKQWHTAPSPELLLATIYHDVVYEPGFSTNEARSAELADKELASLGVPVASRTRICRMILATASHALSADKETSLLLDADMAILAAPTREYDDYAQAIRKEHANLKPALFSAGRKKFLLKTLCTTRLFHSRPGKALALRARYNLLRELVRVGTRKNSGGRPEAQRQTLALSTGTTCDIVAPGSQWVPGYQVLTCYPPQGEPTDRELEELAGIAVREARRKAREVLGSPDRYLIIQSGPSVRRRKHYHCHLIPLASRMGKASVYLFLAAKNYLSGIRTST